MKRKHHRIPPQQTGRARTLRRDWTFPERLLWGKLKRKQLNGWRFRRQHPVGPFIVDFYCPAASLVIELDGLSHAGRAEADRQRTAYLIAEGKRIIRYTNDDVLADVDAVAEDILRHCENTPDPPPAPP